MSKQAKMKSSNLLLSSTTFSKEISMDTRNRTKLTIKLTILLLLALPAASQAALIEMDFSAPGDKLLTLDTTTSLQWLDVTETIGDSYNDAETAFPTFRHATEAEVLAIISQFGITANNGWQAANFAPAQTMLDTMGYVLNPNGGTPFHQAFYDSGSATQTDLALVQLTLSNSTGIANVPQGAPFSKTQSSAVVANYLVRIAPVPEPSAFILAALSLLSLGFVAYRRRRR